MSPRVTGKRRTAVSLGGVGAHRMRARVLPASGPLVSASVCAQLWHACMLQTGVTPSDSFAVRLLLLGVGAAVAGMEAAAGMCRCRVALL